MRYNLHWSELHNVVIKAKTEQDAEEIWASEAYDLDTQTTDIDGKPEITPEITLEDND